MCYFKKSAKNAKLFFLFDFGSTILGFDFLQPFFDK